MDAPDPPETPNPYTTAAAQTGSNVNTAVANSFLQNANVYGPTGSSEFNVREYKTVKEPRRNKDGTTMTERVWVPDGTPVTQNPASTKKETRWVGSGDNGSYQDFDVPVEGGQSGGGYYEDRPAYDTYEIPQFDQKITLSPDQQQLLDNQETLGIKMGEFGIQQVDQLKSVLGDPFKINNIEGLQNVSDFAGDRSRVEDALYARINPQLERERAGLDNKLANEGFTRGTEAYNQAMDEYTRQANDARLGVIMQGGNEQSRLMAQAAALRQAQIQEALLERSQPVNEIGALMSGSQVSMPQFAGFQGGQIANTPVGDYVYRTADLDQKNYQQQVAQANAANAGLMGLGGSVVKGFFGLPFMSDIRIKRDITRLATRRDGLGVYSFRYKFGGGLHVGFMAQEVERLYPDAVTEIAGVKHVYYDRVPE